MPRIQSLPAEEHHWRLQETRRTADAGQEPTRQTAINRGRGRERSIGDAGRLNVQTSLGSTPHGLSNMTNAERRQAGDDGDTDRHRQFVIHIPTKRLDALRQVPD
jgi:hypothetical protein